MAPAPPGESGASRGIGRQDLALYALTVLVWGTSWIALKRQVGPVSPEVSCFWRFALASILMVGWVAWRGELRLFDRRAHLWFALTGVTMFSSNFVLFLYGGTTLPSGLMAVVFSLASIGNLVLAAVLLGQRPERRVAAGGFIGVLGVALLYAPEIVGGLRPGALAGLGLCTLATLCFCCGNLAATRVQRANVPLLAGNAWGMAYGTIFLAILSLARGQPFIIEWSSGYLASLIYLAVGASVIAFAAYLSLVRRIGPARAGYATVLFPVVALAISTFAEDYRWSALSLAGLALALGGNLLVLTRRAPNAIR